MTPANTRQPAQRDADRRAVTALESLSVDTTRPGDLTRALAEDTRRELSRRGFELDRERASLTFQGEAILPSAVLTHDRPDLEGEDMHAVRASLRVGYDSAFAAWLRALPRAARYGDYAARAAIDGLRPHERAALSEGVSTSGGFAIPASSLLAFNNARSQASTIRAAGARVVPVATDELQLPKMAPNSTTTYGSSFIGAWQPEVPSNIFDTGTTVQMVTVQVRKIMAAMKVSRDLADDAPGLLDFLAAEAGLTVGALEDIGFWSGSGVNGEPVGIVNQVASTDDVEGTTANTVSNTNANAGSFDKLIDAQALLPTAYQSDAQWFMRPSVAAKVRKLVDAGSNRAWPAWAADFLGKPVARTDGLAADTADGNRVVAYGSIAGGVVIAERLGVSIDVDPSPFRATGELALVVKTRVGVALLHPQALRVGAV